MSQDSGKKLYVGSLPYSATEEELRGLFSPYGEVASANIIVDKFTGQSKGFGFVEMVNEKDVDETIRQLNGHAMGGRTLVVSRARPMQERSGPSRDRAGGGRRDDRRGGGGYGGEERGGYRSRDRG